MIIDFEWRSETKVDYLKQGCPTRGPRATCDPREGSQWPARVFRNDQYYQLNCYVIYGELTFKEICIYCLLSFKLILLYHNALCFTSHFPYCYVHILSTQSCSCFKSQSVSNRLGLVVMRIYVRRLRRKNLEIFGRKPT